MLMDDQIQAHVYNQVTNQCWYEIQNQVPSHVIMHEKVKTWIPSSGQIWIINMAPHVTHVRVHVADGIYDPHRGN
jgi:hypothetical protein